MISLPIVVCAVLVLTVVGIGVLPWTEARLEASAAAWGALGRIVRRAVSGPRRFDLLAPRAGVRPPDPPPVWAPPAEVALRRAS